MGSAAEMFAQKGNVLRTMNRTLPVVSGLRVKRIASGMARAAFDTEASIPRLAEEGIVGRPCLWERRRAEIGVWIESNFKKRVGIISARSSPFPI